MTTLSKVLRLGFGLATILSGVLSAFFLLLLVAATSERELGVERIVLASGYLAVTVASAAGCLTLTVMDHRAQNLPRVRNVATWTLIALVTSLVLTVMISGLRPASLIYLYELGWLTFFLVVTDPALDRSARFHSPWGSHEQLERKGYIALNFYNIFWIFMVASVAGLIIEVIFRALTQGRFEDRAGLLWGPFSPIYGFGAALMTVALNRFWDKSKLFIFLVSGLIGAAFEYSVSYFLQKAFGIVAWDYSGTFLNIHGRTSFAFFLAWSFLGLVWIRLLLPDVLRIVDAVPLRWRTVLTVVATLLMLADGVTTLVALDCWYQRSVAAPQTNVVQLYCAQHFDDRFMAERFQSMTLHPETSGRLQGAGR